MHVQPYFPEPLKVADSVESQEYFARVRFAKKILFGHVGLVVASCLVAAFSPFGMDLLESGIATLVIIIALTLARRYLPAGPFETAISAAGLIAFVPSIGWFCAGLDRLGVPIWAIPVSALLISIYLLACGRDFSFMGLMMLSAIAFAVGVTGAALFFDLRGLIAWEAFGIAGAYLGYVVYDLSMIMKRRRKTEVVSALADLYRDLLNFTTYPVRVWLHWKKYPWFSQAPER